MDIGCTFVMFKFFSSSLFEKLLAANSLRLCLNKEFMLFVCDLLISAIIPND